MDIFHNSSKHINLTEEEKLIFNKFLKSKKIRKKQFLLHEGTICEYSAYIISGCLRAYSIDEEGFEHILQFAPEGWWVTDMYSLISGKPGHLNIDALEDTEVVLLYKNDQQELYQLVPKFERYFRILAENSLVGFRQRVLDNMELTAKERYAKFCSVYPTLINNIPQKQLAAYIGVTPQFLSKIRTEYLYNK